MALTLIELSDDANEYVIADAVRIERVGDLQAASAVVFDDGVLIFQGPKMVNWVPDAALDRDEDGAAIRTLVESKLPTNNAMGTTWAVPG